MATAPGSQPPGNTAWMQGVEKDGSPLTVTPTTIFLLYMVSLDKVVRSLTSGVLGPLTQATNDKAAAAAGVPINGLYRNGNAVQIRLT